MQQQTNCKAHVTDIPPRSEKQFSRHKDSSIHLIRSNKFLRACRLFSSVAHQPFESLKSSKVLGELMGRNPRLSIMKSADLDTAPRSSGSSKLLALNPAWLLKSTNPRPPAAYLVY